jgi:DNA-directed RNA polymerase II subunit RPB2
MSQKSIHKLVELFFNDRYRPYYHHHNSYNQFVTDCVLKEFEEPRLILEKEHEDGNIYRHYLKYNDVSLSEPTDEISVNAENAILFPEDFKTRNLHYTGRLTANIEQIREVYNPELDKVISSEVLYSDSNVYFGSIPIMLRSKYCNTVRYKDMPNLECDYNPGGYFIVKGSEKVVIPQKNVVFNRPLIFAKKNKESVAKPNHTIKIFSMLVENLNSNLQIVQIIMKKGIMMLSMSQMSEIPVTIVIKALGIVTDKEIIDYITMDNDDVDIKNAVRETLMYSKDETWKYDNDDINEEPKKIITQMDAKNYLVSKIRANGKRFSLVNKERNYKQRYEYLHSVIFKRDLIPHMSGNQFNKACYICLACNKLINYSLGRIPADDRDSLVNERLETTGILLGQIFRQAVKKTDSELMTFARNKSPPNPSYPPANVIAQIKHTTIEQTMHSPLASGTWGNTGKTGVAQHVKKYTLIQLLSVLKRVVTAQITSTSKETSMRFVHNTQYGFIDEAETPEGHNVGITKQLTNMATISTNSPAQPAIIKDLLKGKYIELINLHPTKFNILTKLYINGEWLGMVDNPVEVTTFLKDKRISGEIEKQVGIAYNVNTNEININTDAGRTLRPLLRVKDNKLVLTEEMLKLINIRDNSNPEQIHKWNEFMAKFPETIDFVDPEEQETLLIAMWVKDLDESRERMNTAIKNPDFFGNPVNRYDETVYKRYTHCEFHPSMVFGNTLSNSVFIEHNKGPRNYYSFSQQKQAIGIYMTNHRHRIDEAYLLYYPQRPLVFPRTSKYTYAYDLPYTQNCMVAIAMLTGYNQEDSMLMKRSAVERGLFAIECYKKEKTTIEKTNSTVDEKFKKPDKNRTTGMKDANYEKLNEKGFVNEETPIFNNDVIHGKTTPIVTNDTRGSKNSEVTEKDASVVYKSGVPGVINKVVTEFKNQEGFITYTTGIRQVRLPVGGDKFCSFHGQKGTIGYIVNDEDMPYNEQGIRPDIVLNACCIPSRQTIGQLLEAVMSKYAAIIGKPLQIDQFEPIDMDPVMAKLSEYKEKVVDYGIENTKVDEFYKYGSETMYNGFDGRKFDNPIFMNLTAYMRLKHLVNDKVHARARGPMTTATRQPTEGRQRDGGFRLGEMERDAFIGHGLSHTLKENFMEGSDKYHLYVCGTCKLIARKKINKNVYVCDACEALAPYQKSFQKPFIKKVQLPFAAKQLIQSLGAVGIKACINTEDNIYTNSI